MALGKNPFRKPPEEERGGGSSTTSPYTSSELYGDLIGLGKNPFEVKEPLEEKPPVEVPPSLREGRPPLPTIGGVPFTPTSAVTPPPGGGALPPIPPKGIPWTVEGEKGEPMELRILEDFEFVGTERRLRSEDYLVFYEGREVGRYLRETGKFQAYEPTLWEKTLGITDKVLEWLFVLPSFVGSAIGYLGHELEKRSKMTDEELEAYKEAGLPVESFEDIKMFLPGGEWHAKLKASPFWVRLVLESPFWVGAAMSGVTATKARAAAESLPATLRVPIRAVLAPAAGYEWAVSRTFSYLFGRPLRWVAGKVGQRQMTTAFHKSKAYSNFRAQYPQDTATRRTLERELFRGFRFYHEGNTVAAQQVYDHMIQGGARLHKPGSRALVLYTGSTTFSTPSLGVALPSVGQAVVGANPATTTAIAKVADTIISEGLGVAQITPAFVLSQVPQGITLEKTASLVAQLTEIGHTSESITAMKPEEAWANLFKPPAAEVAPAEVPAGPEVPRPSARAEFPDVPQPTSGIEPEDIPNKLRESFGVAKPGDRILAILPDGTPIKAPGTGPYQHRGVASADELLNAGVIRVVPIRDGTLNIEIRGAITNQQRATLLKAISDSEGAVVDITDASGGTIIAEIPFGTPREVNAALRTHFAKSPAAEVAPVEALITPPPTAEQMPTIQSVVAKIVANQPLTTAERQLYANQSQAVEAALQEQVTPGVTPVELPSEDVAVTEVAGAPPKPPKDFDKIGGQLYDRFKGQLPETTPSIVPPSGRMLRLWPKLEKITTDEFARLNWLGWQAELDVAMVRASGGQAAQVYRETIGSIRNSLGGDDNLVSYVDDYLMLRHQLEILRATERKHFTVVKGGTTQRFTAKEIGLIFAQMKKDLGAIRYAKVKEAASHIPAVYNQILKGTQELTQGQIDGLIKKYPWYNPIVLKRETSPININGPLTARQVKSLTRLEASAEQISPLMSLGTTIARGKKAQAINDARKSIAELAVDPRNTRLIGGGVEIVTKQPIGAFVDYFDNGVTKYLKLGKGAEWIAKDIELFQRQPPSVTIKMVRSLQNLTKMFLTTYNLGFVASNTGYDFLIAYFTEGIGPWGFGKTLAGNIKAMFTEVPDVEEFRRAGGEMFGFFEKGPGEGLGITGEPKDIGGLVSMKKGQIVLRNPNSLKRFLNPLEIVRELGIAGENAARRATYEKAIKEGLPPKEATLRGRRVSVDFTRFSEASRIVNDWFLYFNPAMQGFLLPGRAVAKNPRSLWRLGLLLAAYVGLTYYNQSYDEYKDVRDSDKVNKFLVMLPSNEFNKYGQKVPHYLTLLPLREFAIFTAPIEYIMGRLRTEQPEAYRTIGQEWDVLYPAISPLSMISESGGIKMPTQVGATIDQILRNHDDFRDRPIVDDEMALLPPSQQYDQYTNKMAIRIGQATGMSPKKLDFFASNMFGALGSDLLRILDWGIQQIDSEQVDERIARLVNELRTISSTVPPNQIEVARETFLEGLSVEDRDLVLNMERIPDDRFMFLQSLFNRFYRDYGGQVYQTAKEKALANRTLDEYPPEALEQLQKDAIENANNLIAGKITKYQYDQNRTRYRAYYSGGSTAQWREAMLEGGVARADIDKYMPESYQRAGEFQAVSAYMEIRQKHIDMAGGVFDSDTWDSMEVQTLTEMRRYFTQVEINYALAHKDDWIDKLPEPARTTERQRAIAIEDETWWDNYRGTEKRKPTTSRTTQPTSDRDVFKSSKPELGRPSNPFK